MSGELSPTTNLHCTYKIRTLERTIEKKTQGQRKVNHPLNVSIRFSKTSLKSIFVLHANNSNVVYDSTVTSRTLCIYCIIYARTFVWLYIPGGLTRSVGPAWGLVACIVVYT